MESSFVLVKLRRNIVKNIISTYEFLAWDNTGLEKSECKKILKALKESLKIETDEK